MKGILYGIGVGPGDPELLTIKAVNTIQACDIIAVPKTKNGDKTAFAIIETYIGNKELLECSFSMEQNLTTRKADRQNVAADIMQLLKSGKNIGFVTLGDPTTYSTYMYLHEAVVSHGFQAVIIPGITSYAAAAAALGVALCEGNETLTIIPAAEADNIDKLLDYPGNKVIMKSGTKLPQVLAALTKRGYQDQTKIAYQVTMADQQLYANIAEYHQAPQSGYFTLLIVKEKP